MSAEQMGETHTRLIVEHEDLEAVLRQLIASYESGDRDLAAAAYRVAEDHLRSHFLFEESQLFPDFAHVDPVETNALRAEHAALRRTLDELGVAVELHQTRSGPIREFVQRLRTHAARENALLYRWVDRGGSDPTRRPSIENHFVHGRSPAHPEAA